MIREELTGPFTSFLVNELEDFGWRFQVRDWEWIRGTRRESGDILNVTLSYNHQAWIWVYYPGGRPAERSVVVDWKETDPFDYVFKRFLDRLPLAVKQPPLSKTGGSTMDNMLQKKWGSVIFNKSATAIQITPMMSMEQLIADGFTHPLMTYLDNAMSVYGWMFEVDSGTDYGLIATREGTEGGHEITIGITPDFKNLNIRYQGEGSDKATATIPFKSMMALPFSRVFAMIMAKIPKNAFVAVAFEEVDYDAITREKAHTHQ